MASFTAGLVERTGATVVAAQTAAVSSAVALAKVPESDVANVLGVCKKMGLCFVDLSFLPAKCADDGAVWYRAKDALNKAPPVMPAHTSNAHPLAIPGVCSNRYWLSLLSLAGTPSMVPEADPATGYAVVVLDGCNVIIDDLLPWKKGVPLHATASAPWLPILEKAIAKKHGSYAKLPTTFNLNQAAASLGIGSPSEHTFHGGDLSLFLSHAHASLVLLKPSGRTLHQPNAFYTVAAVTPSESCVLVYCPVSDQPLTPTADPVKLLDAHWVSLSDLPTLFASWAAITSEGTCRPRPVSPVNLPSLMQCAPPTGTPAPPPLPLPTETKVATLEQEVHALTQLHLDALQSARAEPQRVRMLQDVFARMQDDNEKKVTYKLDDGMLEVLGEKWVRHREGEVIDYSAQVQRQAKELALKDKRHRLEVEELMKQVTSLQRVADTGGAKQGVEAASIIEAQKSHINQLYTDLNTLASTPTYVPPPLTTSDPVVSELEFTIKSLSKQLAEAHLVVQETEGVRIELLESRELTKKLHECFEAQELTMQHLELQLQDERHKTCDIVLLQDRFARLEKEHAKAKTTVTELQSGTAQLEAAGVEQEVERTTLQHSNTTLKADADRASEEIEALNEKLIAVSAELATVQLDSTAMEAELASERNVHALLKDQHAVVTNERTTLESTVSQLQAAVARLEGDNEAHTKTTEALQTQISDKVREMQNLHATLTATAEEVRGLENGKGELATETAKLAADLANMSRQYRESLDSNVAKEREVTELTAVMAELKRELQVEKTSGQTLTEAKCELQSAAAAVKSERDTLQEELKVSRSTVTVTTAENERLACALKTALEDLNTKNGKVLDLNTMLQSSQDTANTAQNQCIVLQETSATEKSKIQQLLLAVDTANSTIKDMSGNLSGAQQSLRTVTSELESQKQHGKTLEQRIDDMEGELEVRCREATAAGSEVTRLTQNVEAAEAARGELEEAKKQLEDALSTARDDLGTTRGDLTVEKQTAADLGQQLGEVTSKLQVVEERAEEAERKGVDSSKQLQDAQTSNTLLRESMDERLLKTERRLEDQEEENIALRRNMVTLLSQPQTPDFKSFASPITRGLPSPSYRSYSPRRRLVP